MNYHLFKWKVKKNDECEYCNESQTVAHFFWECHEVSKMWKWLEEYLKKKVPNETCSITKKNVFTNLINENPSHIFNFHCLVLKQYLYACKCLKKKICTKEVDRKFEMFRKYEFYHAQCNNKLMLHFRKWFIHTNDTNYNETGFSDVYIHNYLENCT